MDADLGTLLSQLSQYSENYGEGTSSSNGKEQDNISDDFDITWPDPGGSGGRLEDVPETSGGRAEAISAGLEKVFQVLGNSREYSQKLKELGWSRNPDPPKNFQQNSLMEKLLEFTRAEPGSGAAVAPEEIKAYNLREDASFLNSTTSFPMIPPPVVTTSPHFYPPVPGVSADSFRPILKDSEWDKATRAFQERLKAKDSSHRKRSRSPEKSRDESRKKSRSISKEPTKKNEKLEKKEVKTKEEGSASIDQSIGILSSQIDEMKLRKYEMEKRESLLSNEMERMKKQHGDLCRKLRRQKDGHKDVLLVENTRLQKEIQRQLDNLGVMKKEIETTLKATEPRLNALKARRKEKKEASTKTPVKNEGSSVFYEYYDGGAHFCVPCSVTCSTVYDMLFHLHTPLHKSRSGHETPWTPAHVKDPSQAKKPEASQKVVLDKLKGVEFLEPCVGFYCKLCKEFSGDAVCAGDHLKSQKHGNSYRKYVESHSDYEMLRQTEKARFMMEKTEKTAFPPAPSGLLPTPPVTEEGKKFEPQRQVKTSADGLNIQIKVPVNGSPKQEHRSSKSDFRKDRNYPEKQRSGQMTYTREEKKYNGDREEKKYKDERKSVESRWDHHQGLSMDAVTVARAVKNRLDGKASAEELSLLTQYNEMEKSKKDRKGKFVSTMRRAEPHAGKVSKIQAAKDYEGLDSLSVLTDEVVGVSRKRKN